MTKFILIVLIALVFEAIGVVFLSGGLNQIGEPKTINAVEIMSLIKRGATNKNILIGVFFEAITLVSCSTCFHRRTSASFGR